ncbi:radical SAM/SPASM domain-containing protein [Heyndrickxia sp. NPDC080065]|uniref:radical SAM protein n=1 Tax=Heyndrickxia sp. NPDC080065 TaxID=3390568 RepID=UPI003D03EDC6
MFVKWDITQRCNLSCSHCTAVETYGEMTPIFKEPELEFEEIKKIIDDFAINGVKAIHFLGGEPLIRKDFFDILEYCAKKEIRFGINTNGGYFGMKQIDRLSKISDYIADITFSIDGGDEETNDLVRSRGSFKGVVRGLQNVLNSPLGLLPGNPVNTNTCLTKPLVKNIDKLLNLFDTMPNLKRMTFTTLEIEGGAKETQNKLEVDDPKELIDVLEKIVAWASKRPHLTISVPGAPKVLNYLNKKYNMNFPIQENNCPAGSVLSYVDARGKMYPCNRWNVINFIEDNGIAKWEKNDLHDNKFEDIYNSDSWKQFFRFAHNPAIMSQRYPCNSCEFVSSCYSCPISVSEKAVNVAYTCLIAEERMKQLVAN